MSGRNLKSAEQTMIYNCWYGCKYKNPNRRMIREIRKSIIFRIELV